MSDGKKRKGVFGDTGLPVSKRYVFPSSRKRMMVIGAVAVAALGAYIALDSFLIGKRFISTGALSAAHARLEGECSACHGGFQSVSSEKCSGCHEIAGNRGRVYAFSGHYVYRSANVDRLRSRRVADSRARESECRECHLEHNGRQAVPIEAADAACASCHGGYEFDDHHREFQFAREGIPDSDNLTFPHVYHVREMFQFADGLTDETLHKACSRCHQLEADGRHFASIEFERHCGGSDCHLSTGGVKHLDKTALGQAGNECEWCHKVTGGNVAPVAAEQKVLHRAEFDHGAHLVAANCLDCHNAIQMTERVPSANKPDEATTQNIPTIDNCRQCHNSKTTTNRCVSCHQFHPNKSLRFELTNAQRSR